MKKLLLGVTLFWAVVLLVSNVALLWACAWSIDELGGLYRDFDEAHLLLEQNDALSEVGSAFPYTERTDGQRHALDLEDLEAWIRVTGQGDRAFRAVEGAIEERARLLSMLDGAGFWQLQVIAIFKATNRITEEFWNVRGALVEGLVKEQMSAEEYRAVTGAIWAALHPAEVDEGSGGEILSANEALLAPHRERLRFRPEIWRVLFEEPRVLVNHVATVARLDSAL